MKNKITLPKKDIIVILFCASFLFLCLGAIGSTGRYRQKMVLCKLNQKKMTIGTLMYANDNAGNLYKTSLDLWLGPLSAYINQDEVRYCPATAKNPNQPPLNQWIPNQLFGTAKIGWVWNFREELEYGSYAFNGWLYSDNSSSYAEAFSNISEVQQPATTPLFADSRWVDTWPGETDTCSANFDLNLGSHAMMGRLLLNRHFGRTNVSFVDGHVDSVELRHLWSLTWHKVWTPIETITRDDGSPIYPE